MTHVTRHLLYNICDFLCYLPIDFKRITMPCTLSVAQCKPYNVNTGSLQQPFRPITSAIQTPKYEHDRIRLVTDCVRMDNRRSQGLSKGTGTIEGHRDYRRSHGLSKVTRTIEGHRNYRRSQGLSIVIGSHGLLKVKGSIEGHRDYQQLYGLSKVIGTIEGHRDYRRSLVELSKVTGTIDGHYDYRKSQGLSKVMGTIKGHSLGSTEGHRDYRRSQTIEGDATQRWWTIVKELQVRWWQPTGSGGSAI